MLQANDSPDRRGNTEANCFEPRFSIKQAVHQLDKVTEGRRGLERAARVDKDAEWIAR